MIGGEGATQLAMTDGALLQIKITGPSGKVLLMPEQDPSATYIMVATGTGIAPFRGFMRRLFGEGTPAGRAFSGLAWLFLGVANKDSLLYDEEFQTYRLQVLLTAPSRVLPATSSSSSATVSSLLPCPVSTEGGTRRVQSVREGGGKGGALLPSEAPFCCCFSGFVSRFCL